MQLVKLAKRGADKVLADYSAGLSIYRNNDYTRVNKITVTLRGERSYHLDMSPQEAKELANSILNALSE